MRSAWVKVPQKIPGCYRTFEGAVGFVRLRSYLATTAKNLRNTYAVLGELFNGHSGPRHHLNSYQDSNL